MLLVTFPERSWPILSPQECATPERISGMDEIAARVAG
jgi:hypothetical protein